MKSISNDKHLELIEKLRKGKMLHQPGVAFHVNKALTTGDYSGLYDYLKRYPAILAIAEQNIAIETTQKTLDPYAPYPSRDEVRESLTGPIKLGIVNEYGDMFGIYPDEFCTPTIIFGVPGSGKSVLIKYIIIHILSSPSVSNFVIPDMKPEYRDLLSLCDNLFILTKDRVLINFLEVPSWCHPMEHIESFSKIFVGMNYLVGTSSNLLFEIIESMYRSRGIFDGSQNYPTLKDLYNVIKAKQNSVKSFRFFDVLEWLANRLKPYTLIDNFACQHGIPFEYFIQKNLVLELDKKFTDMQVSMISAFLAKQIYDHNKNKRLTGSKLRTLFLIDEARLLFQERDITIFGENPLNETASKSREFGIGFLVCTQEPDSISQVMRSLSRLKIAFPLSDGKDLELITKSFGLNEDQKDHINTLPKHAAAVVRYSGFPRPFILEVPNFHSPQALSDEDIEEKMADFYSELKAKIKRSETPIPPEVKSETMPPACAALLFHLANNPFKRLTDLQEKYKSSKDLKKILTWLESKSFLKSEKFRASVTRKATYYVLQQKAYDYLDIKRPPGLGSFEHQLFQNHIQEWLKSKGYQPKIEGRMQNSTKAIDVLFYSDEKQGYIAVEVTLNFHNLLHNIIEDLNFGVSEVIVVCRNKTEMKKANAIVKKSELSENDLNKVNIQSIDYFFS